MRKFEFYMSMGIVGCKIKEIVEIDDDVTDEEIEAIHLEWVGEQLDTSWREIK